MMESALVQELTDNAAVSALVGTGASARIYPQIAAQGAAKPYLVYQLISGEHGHHLRAASGLVQSRVQIDSYGSTYSGAKTLADKVRLALDGQLAGTLGSGSYTASIRSITLENEQDGFDNPRDGGALGIHRVIQDYSIWHTETVPTF